jgi:hypothetical protein
MFYTKLLICVFLEELAKGGILGRIVMTKHLLSARSLALAAEDISDVPLF